MFQKQEKDIRERYQHDPHGRKRRKYQILFDDKPLIILNGFTEEEARQTAQDKANEAGQGTELIDITYLENGCSIDSFEPETSSLKLVQGGAHG